MKQILKLSAHWWEFMKSWGWFISGRSATMTFDVPKCCLLVPWCSMFDDCAMSKVKKKNPILELNAPPWIKIFEDCQGNAVGSWLTPDHPKQRSCLLVIVLGRRLAGWHQCVVVHKNVMENANWCKDSNNFCVVRWYMSTASGLQPVSTSYPDAELNAQGFQPTLFVVCGEAPPQTSKQQFPISVSQTS